MAVVEYTNVDRLRFGNPEGTVICCFVTVPSILGGEPLDMAAREVDPGWDTSEDIFKRAKVGEFGPIAPYVEPVPLIPDRVTRRQFRLALIDAGLLEQVEGWVATQDIRTQAAYADSGTFLRTDEMLQQGFAGLGFTEEQVDQFFADAVGL